MVHPALDRASFWVATVNDRMVGPAVTVLLGQQWLSRERAIELADAIRASALSLPTSSLEPVPPVGKL